MLSRASNSGLFSPQQTNAHTKIRSTLFETSFGIRATDNRGISLRIFPPPTYLSVETTRTGRVLSWIIRKKERKKKKENRKSIDYCDDFITIGFITGRDRYLEREPVLQPVFLTQHVTARGSYFRESREIYEIQLEATTSLFEVYTAFEKES